MEKTFYRLALTPLVGPAVRILEVTARLQNLQVRYAAGSGKAKAGMAHPIADESMGVQVKL